MRNKRRLTPHHPHSTVSIVIARYRRIELARRAESSPHRPALLHHCRCSAIHACYSLALLPLPLPSPSITIATYQPGPLAASSYTCFRSDDCTRALAPRALARADAFGASSPKRSSFVCSFLQRGIVITSRDVGASLSSGAATAVISIACALHLATRSSSRCRADVRFVSLHLGRKHSQRVIACNLSMIYSRVICNDVIGNV